VNSKTHTLLGYWDFYGKNVDDAWYLLKWIAWDSFEFEKASCVCKSYYAPFWCDLCNSSDRATNLSFYYACYDQSDFVSPWDNTDVVLDLPDS